MKVYLKQKNKDLYINYLGKDNIIAYVDPNKIPKAITGTTEERIRNYLDMKRKNIIFV